MCPGIFSRCCNSVLRVGILVIGIRPTSHGMPSGEYARLCISSVGSLGEGRAMLVSRWVVTVSFSPNVAENRLDSKHIVAGILDVPLIGRPAAHVKFDSPCAAAEELQGTLGLLPIDLGT